MTKEYELARLKHNQACRTFAAIQSDYRARKIGDAEYLAGRTAYDESTAEFDVAFSAEEKLDSE